MNYFIKKWSLSVFKFTEQSGSKMTGKSILWLVLFTVAVFFGTELLIDSNVAYASSVASDIINQNPTFANASVPDNLDGINHGLENALIIDSTSPSVWYFLPIVMFLVLGALTWYVIYRKRTSGDNEITPQAVNQLPTNQSNARLFKKRHQILDVLSGDIESLFEGKHTIGHLMSDQITSVRPTYPVKEMRKLMRDKALRHLMVCDENQRFLGVISNRDFKQYRGKTAADIMTRNPITVTSNTLISPAITLMMNKRISCLPVVDDDAKLCGVFTTTDVMMTLQCALQILQKAALQFGDGFVKTLSQSLDQEESELVST